MKFPFSKQLDSTDCGPACLQMISKYYGKFFSLNTLRELTDISRNGVNLRGINNAARTLGYKTKSVQMNWEQLSVQTHLPCIIHWDNNHFVVVYGVNIEKSRVKIADPAFGRIVYGKEEFLKHWITDDRRQIGVGIILHTTDEFYNKESDVISSNSMSRVLSYLKPHTKYFLLLISALLMGSLLNLIFPFLAQAIVDVGIEYQDMNIILIICVAQLMLVVGQLGNDLFQSWIMLNITTRISISFISDFLNKLMKLPISYFEVSLVGDTMQRINDNRRIQTFLTSTLISGILAFTTFLVYTTVISRYNFTILLVFIFGSTLYILWILSFLKKRRELDFKEFKESSSNQSNLFQLVTTMQEIKINGCEAKKQSEWERIQYRLYHIGAKSLSIAQAQGAGGDFVNQIKNIIISFIAANSVVHGEMTLGMMIAMQYVLGQLNGPLNQFLSLMKETQDAKIGLERINEVYNREDEEPKYIKKTTNIPANVDIHFKNVSFSYGGPYSRRALNSINLKIESGKVTAIVGTSGSGKTTLLKLLLRYYNPNQGEILLGNTPLNIYSEKYWRSKCGVVMQEGAIFSESIAYNIGIVDDKPDDQMIRYSAKISNIDSFIESLPLKYETKIGREGNILSTGQTQRILIARAVYKNPRYIFLDEATNSLDTTNESIIMNNLQEFYKGRTVVVVAHRLSTVKKADNIIVLDKGKIVETGTHEQLVNARGTYYQLIENQLELNH